jgi:serine/threonine protein kinase
MAGTLPYMAPEQTSRMNRSMDARSDLYALGNTLYQMLTSTLPFAAADPLEWSTCHIAELVLVSGYSDVGNRFQLVFRRFVGAFARPEHPLALIWLNAQQPGAFTPDCILLTVLHSYLENRFTGPRG